MGRRLDIIYTTMAAELLDRALDAQFDSDFSETGTFIEVPVEGRSYWYYKFSQRDGQKDGRKYVGPVDDAELTSRVQKFRELKTDFQARRKIVSTLVREGRLFSPERRVGDLIEAFWKAGLFRLRACLVGTVAYQTYGTVLGYRFSGSAMQTGDIDVAQFHSISVAVDDTIPPVLDVLHEVDSSFRAAPALNDAQGSTRYVADGGLRVDFLTPNRGSDEFSGKPAKMPSLGGAAAEPLRFLDFLIYEPVRTVLLHKGGIPVTVPDPARFAIHKLVVAARRRIGSGKDMKDLEQAGNLVKALEETARLEDLRERYREARDRGPAWREAIDTSLLRMRQLKMNLAPDLLAHD
ncbi:nucleotidyltransferase family protein [Mesorhizobium sp. CN2-181]|uniref:nucleotidyltransferase family protein n=1 Tax=Mesorhizobium yinganensis TaxID=3157707 RepID=UPI0032B876EB